MTNQKASLKRVTQETEATPPSSAPQSVSPITTNQETSETSRTNEWPDAKSRPLWRVYDTPVSVGSKSLPAGLYWHNIQYNKDDKPPTLTDDWICGPVHVDAITSNEGSSFGRLLRIKNINGNWKQFAIPMGLLAGSTERLLEQLLDMGLNINIVRKSKIPIYINSTIPHRRITAAQQTGWKNDVAFVFPEQTLGDQSYIFQGKPNSSSDYSTKGSLSTWKNTVAKYCEGNPVMTLTISFALAGPLLKLLSKDNGGLHLLGDSSCGKTTCLAIASSVWGNPKDFMRTWRSTANGLESVSTDRNDTTLILDELGEAEANEVSKIVYAIANGLGKQRATKLGTSQSVNKWRQSIISSGEISPEDLIASTGSNARAGVSMRLLNITCSREYGAFDQLHEHLSGRRFSDNLKQNCNQNYGFAGPEFINRLLEMNDLESLHERFEDIKNSFTCKNGQESRAADRFIIAALAGELASHFGILPWVEGSAICASVMLFNEWKLTRGNGTSEDSQILKNIHKFISRYGDSKFTSLSQLNDKVHERAGWWKEIKNDDGTSARVWLFTSSGLEMSCRGYAIRRIISALNKSGCIVEKDAGKNSKTTRLGSDTQRLYYLKISEDLCGNVH